MVDSQKPAFRIIEGDGLEAEQSDVPADSVGDYLREARETTGRRVDDIAAVLNIRAKFLRAIETSQYGDLPGPTYAVGFIRSYAEYLGLDGDALVERYKAESSSAGARPDLDFPVQSSVGSAPTGKIVAVCVVLALAVFGGWYVVQTENLVDVAAVPVPPGFKSALGLDDAGDDNAGVDGAENSVLTATDGGGVADGSSYQLQVPVNELVSADPVAAIAEVPSLEAGEHDGASELAAPPSADADPAPAGSVVTESATGEPVSTEAEDAKPEVTAARSPEAVEPEPKPAGEPAVADVRAAQPAPQVVAEPAPAAVAAAPAEETAGREPADEAPESLADEVSTAAPTPAPRPAARPAPRQTSALPSIPETDANSGDTAEGRTFGVVNQEARVVIGARDDSWVQVLDGEQNVVLTRMLRAGDRYLVPDREDLVMLTGNAGALIISVDGEPVPEIGTDGAILHNVRLDVELLKAGRAVIQ